MSLKPQERGIRGTRRDWPDCDRPPVVYIAHVTVLNLFSFQKEVNGLVAATATYNHITTTTPSRRGLLVIHYCWGWDDTYQYSGVAMCPVMIPGKLKPWWVEYLKLYYLYWWPSFLSKKKHLNIPLANSLMLSFQRLNTFFPNRTRNHFLLTETKFICLFTLS